MQKDIYKLTQCCAAVLCVLVLGGCLGGGRMNANQRAERMALEKGRLTDQTNPVEKTRSYIRISGWLLDFVADSARLHDMDALKSLVEQYVTTVKSARDTIVNSGRDPERNSAGYKDLELALRLHARHLNDIRMFLEVDSRQPIDQALEVADSLRQEVFAILFPPKGTSTR